MKRTSWILLGVLAAVSAFLTAGALAADDLTSMFAEGKTSGSVRLYYWGADYDGANHYAFPIPGHDPVGPADAKSFLAGGWLTYETAAFYGISLGAGLRTQNEVTTFDNKDYAPYFYFTDPLKEGNNVGFTGLEQAFVQYRGFDSVLTVGRQHVDDNPYITVDDHRMLLQAYQGVKFTNTSVKGFKFNAGYFTKYVDWCDGEYKNMIGSDTFGYYNPAPNSKKFYNGFAYVPYYSYNADKLDDETRPAIMTGLAWNGIKGLDADFYYYTFTDVYDLWTPHVKYFKFFNRDLKAFVDARYTNWNASGSKLLGDVDTDMVGGTGAVLYKDWMFMFGYQKNGKGHLIESYGNSRIVSNQACRADDAELDAYLLHVGYDFSSVGLLGFSLTARYGVYEMPKTGDYANQDFNELDLIAAYDFGKAFKSLKGLSAELGVGLVDKDDAQASLNTDANTINPNDTSLYKPWLAEDCTDVRLSIKYNF